MTAVILTLKKWAPKQYRVFSLYYAHVLTLDSHFHWWEDSSLLIFRSLYCFNNRYCYIAMCNFWLFNNCNKGFAFGAHHCFAHIVIICNLCFDIVFILGIATIQECSATIQVRTSCNRDAFAFLTQYYHLSFQSVYVCVHVKWNELGSAFLI